MKRQRCTANVVLGMFATLLFWWSSAAVAATHAIIFASDYGGAKAKLKLANAKVDAGKIETALKSAGVADVRLVLDPRANDWERELVALVARTTARDIVIFYYAGHGLQVDGANYFVAADGETLIGIDPVLSLISQKARGTVMIIDACRNNPFRAEKEVALVIDAAIGKSRSLPAVSMATVGQSKGGLAQIGELRGLSAMVLFSTEPGNVAEDGEAGKGSPFAIAVARELTKRESLNAVIRRIAVSVNKATEGRQSPWRQGDLPFDVYVAGMPVFPTP